MSHDPFERLDDQLRQAVRARRTSRVPMSRRGRGPLAVLLSLLIGGGVATAASVLDPGESREAQVRRALTAGARAAEGHPSCTPPSGGLRRRVVDEGAPEDLASQFAVLRRPARPGETADRKTLSNGGEAVLGRTVREARAADGWRFVLWLSRGDATQPGDVDPVACAKVRRAASVRAAAGLPRVVRREVQRSADREVQGLERRRRPDTVSLSWLELDPQGRGLGGGSTMISRGRVPAFGSGGPSRIDGRRVVVQSGFVVDAVRRVRFIDLTGRPRTRSFTVDVRDNVFHAVLPQRMGPRIRVQYLDANGRVLRRLTRTS